MQDHRKSLIDTMEVFNHPSAEKKSLMGYHYPIEPQKHEKRLRIFPVGIEKIVFEIDFHDIFTNFADY